MVSTRSTANTVTEPEDDAWESCSNDSQPAAAPISSSARKRTIKQHLRAKQNRILGITTTPTETGADCVHLKEVLDENPDTDFGFVIYRCTYDSQEKWDRFMGHLTEQTFLNLRGEGAEDLFWRIDWCVQEDAKGLKNASVEKVGRRFKKWVKEHGDGSDWPRYQACVKVDKHDLNSVLTGPSPEDFDIDRHGAVTLVSLSPDEGHCWVGAAYPVPRIFTLLEIGWDNFAPKEAYDVACP